MHKSLIMTGAAALVGLLLAGPQARAAQANYSLPKEPTATSGSINYYSVPLGFTWDHFAYEPNYGDWNVALGDSGFDAGEIPGNPTFCGANGDMCAATAGSAASKSFITINNDPVHGFSNIPLLMGPTQDGFNNVQIGTGQAIPVVPGHYKALYVSYSGVCGPQQKMLSLNYADSSVVSSVKWADWCAPSQASPDFFTWAPTHRLNPASSGSATNGASCALITKYVPVDSNRVLTSISIGKDSNSDGGAQLPGETIQSNCHRLVIGAITLASSDATLGGYGFVSGQVKDASGKALTTPVHDSTAAAGYDVFVTDAALNHYGAGANVDGSYTIGLPAGTYTLSAAVRDGSATSQGPQATPITVTVTAGQTTAQDISLLAAPTPSLWGELKGTVKDASGAPQAGAAILVSESATGPFAAVQSIEDYGAGDGTTQADGTYDLVGLDATHPIFVKAAGNGFASASATSVTLTGGGSVSQDITTAVVPVGNISGTVETPDAQFGGIGVPVLLTSKDLTLTTTTFALPQLSGTAVVPADGSVTATFEFNGIPAGDYMLTLPASAVQGANVSVPVTIAAGQTAKPMLTLAYAAWTEGTTDPKISDPLTGTALDAKWSAKDVGAPTAAGSVKESSSGLAVSADGTGWDGGAQTPDAFNYVSQSIPAGDWVAYVDVTAGTTGGLAGLMVSSSVAAQPYAAHLAIDVTSGAGIVAQGRNADGTSQFPFGETAAGTDPNNSGTQPGFPITLKMRKVGPNVAGFFSTDGGKTQHFIATLAPQFDQSASLLLGMATTSTSDGSLDSATYKNFVFAPLPVVAPVAGP